MNSLKKNIIKGLAFATDTEPLKGNKLILITPLGLVSGVLCDSDGTNPDPAGAQFLTILTEKIAEGYEAKDVQGNDGYLMLSNVTIKSGGNVSYNCNNLIVFYDQIIGVTLGNPG